MKTTTITFEAANFAADTAKRTLTGVLLPFGAISLPALNTQTGQPALWTFPEGTVDVPDDPTDAVLNYGHDTQSLYMQVGAAFSLEIQPGVGVVPVFDIAETPEGDRVLALAKAKVLKHFSAEVEGDFDVDPKHDNEYGLPLMTAKKVTVVGGAVVRKPAFVGAPITNVAAAAAQNKETNMKCTKCGGVHLTGVTACDPAVLAAFEAANAPASFTPADGVKVMADVAKIATELAELKDIKIPVGPGGGAQLQVREKPIYRFAGNDRAESGFDFGEDIYNACVRGDGAALKRLQDFTAAEEEARAQFADQPTTTGDVSGLNQPTYRDDLFLGQAPTPASPLFNFFVKGSLSNVTPFFWVKLDRTNTDVNIADHTEGVEPESRDLVIATGTTVTPQAMSGRVHITREVGDQGGSTKVSALIKKEWDRSFAIAKETKTAAILAAGAGSVSDLGGFPIAAGASGVTLGRAIEGGLIDVQFLADGARFEKMFGHIDAYKALGLATAPRFDGDVIGEKEYPIINPQNRDGVSGSKYAFIDLAGYRMEGAPALGTSNNNSNDSWLADPFAVHVWASGLQSLDKLQEDVEGWDVGAFAYFAGVLYDPTGLRTIPYDKAA